MRAATVAMPEDHLPQHPLTDHFRRQALACASLGSPLYAAVLERAADDLESGGPTAAAVAGFEDAPPGSAVALRLTGAVHRLVLARQAPALAVHYPSVGGTYIAGSAITDDAVWDAFRQVLVDDADVIAPILVRPPQTNETGRSLPLIGGLDVISELSGGRAVRIVEIGTSAGLNLRAEALRSLHTPRDLELLPRGPAYHVVERLGCDPDPIDPTTTEGRLTLSSYVWPDDLARFERLRVALDIARQVPAVVRPVGAAEFLAGIEPLPGVTTVLWHSVMWQYLNAAERLRVLAERDRLADMATDDSPFAHLSFEPPPDGSSTFEVRLRWHSSSTRLELGLGTAPPHGVPVDWVEDMGLR